MKYKLLVLVIFVPAIAIAQPKFDLPLPNTQSAVGNLGDQSTIQNSTTQFQQNQIRQEIINEEKQEILKQEMIELRPLLVPPVVSN